MNKGIKKIRILIIGLVFLIPLIYHFTIRKTIKAYKDYTYTKNNSLSISSIENEVNKLEIKLDSVNANINNESKQINYRQKILDITTNYLESHDLSLMKYHNPIISEYENCFVRNNCVTLNGGFVELVKYIHFMEKSNEVGQIVSVKYYKKYNKYLKKEELLCDVFIQNIITKEK
jgi:hypothetical protein